MFIRESLLKSILRWIVQLCSYLQTFTWLCIYTSNRTCATCGTESAYLSKAHDITSNFCRVYDAQSFLFFVLCDFDCLLICCIKQAFSVVWLMGLNVPLGSFDSFFKSCIFKLKTKTYFEVSLFKAVVFKDPKRIFSVSPSLSSSV